MQRYDSYKDSGIQWLGEIPSHWEIRTLKYCCSLKGRIGWNGLRSEEFQDSSYAYLVTGQDFDGAEIDWSKCYQINQERYDEDPYIQLNNGDLLITKDGTIGKVSKVTNLDKPACLNSGIFVIKQKKQNFVQGYLYWMLCSKVLKEFNVYTQTGATIAHLYQNVFENMPCILPPLPEQQAIASYLDTATAKIDEAIAQQQKMIDLLNERKQIIINNAVTKGLNPNAKMKPSGIDWIGNIPEHWEVRKLKQIAKLRSGDTISSDQFTTSGFPVFGGNGFRGYTDRYTNEGNYVLIGRQGALCGNVNYADGKFFATEHAVVVYPHSSENVIWLGECIKASNLNQYSQSAAQPGLAVSVIGNVSYPYPPTEERDSIAEYIRQNTERLDCSINNATKQIALLQERKQIIINDVVTGKVKVS